MIFVNSYLSCKVLILLKNGGDNLAEKIIELVGTSPQSWPAAVEEAIHRAGESVRNIKAIDVLSLKAEVSQVRKLTFQKMINHR